MTTQTLLYQRALRLLGERELSSVTENREPRHLLDAEDEDGGLITYALETGFWRFASKTEQLSSSGTSAFGLTKTFGKPSNYVHLIELSGDEHFRTPLTRDKFFSNPESSFREDQALFYSMLTTIYIRPIFFFQVFLPLFCQPLEIHSYCFFKAFLRTLGEFHCGEYFADFFPSIFFGNKSPD